MKRIQKIIYSSFLVLSILLSAASPIMAAGSISKEKAETTRVIGYGNDDKGADEATSNGVSSTFVGELYSQSIYYDEDNTSPFTLESQYTKGMTDEEEDEYYQGIHISIYEDADREIVDDKWQRVTDPIIEIINNLNDNKINYFEAIQETYATQDKTISIDDLSSDLVKTMFENYASTCSEKDMDINDFDLNDYSILSEVEDLILYDNDGNIVHGSNIKVTLYNSLINSSIDPDRLFVLHYNTTLESWELIPTTNVDTENGTADVVFNNLSPFTFLYLNSDNEKAETTSTTSSDTCCDDTVCNLLRHKFCKFLCINGTCWCWVIVVILILLLILIVFLMIKAYLDAKKKHGDDDDDSSDDDFII